MSKSVPNGLLKILVTSLEITAILNNDVFDNLKCKKKTRCFQEAFICQNRSKIERNIKSKEKVAMFE
jgi:hypothetical protein